MSGRGSSHPDSETMDITPSSDEQPRYRLPPNPPVGSDEFLHLHAGTITKVIELKAKLLADWFRPQGLDPESTDKLDQEYDATTAEMLALCEGLGMTHGELPNDILALHEKIKPIHLRLHEETTSSHAIQQKPPPTHKGKGKRPLDAEGYQIPPKHLVCKNPAGKPKDLAPLPTGNPFSLPANTPPPSNDPAESTTEKTRKLRIPPYFVRPTPNWIMNMTILKKEFPSITAVHARDNFLKLTVSSEEEHHRLKHKLQEMKAEFKSYNLKQDRPVKIVIRGLPICTSHEPIIEAMKFKGFNVIKIMQLTKSQSRAPMPLFYLQITNKLNVEEVYSINELFGIKISIERYRGRKSPPSNVSAAKFRFTPTIYLTILY
ncbi:RNA-directed DNA polymerase from mobile element jockey [Caerostris darwini]|uniref:RNA-directed DNA polymerase from mobile element jockey n=1 Tax=Caerostris darwini TaxID=1538125 RepID=A0AAV4VD79_9ARAC|nr:RNA-directed DNA polymerase from mobile element jockey [Caerostris darwini]